MDKPYYLKLLPPPKKETDQGISLPDPPTRFRKVVLNLIGNALSCLNRIGQKEMEKGSPSPNLMEEYSLLNHYLGFIKRLCEKKLE